MTSTDTPMPEQPPAGRILKERIATALQRCVEQGNVRYDHLADAVVAEIHAADKIYPRPDGDVTVLGPELFASADGQTISWRGDNYTRQPEEPRVVVYGIDVSEWDRMWGVVSRIAQAVAPSAAADPHPHPMGQIGDCRHCGTSYAEARQQYDGPSVAECADNDQRWDLEREGD